MERPLHGYRGDSWLVEEGNELGGSFQTSTAKLKVLKGVLYSAEKHSAIKRRGLDDQDEGEQNIQLDKRNRKNDAAEQNEGICFCPFCLRDPWWGGKQKSFKENVFPDTSIDHNLRRHAREKNTSSRGVTRPMSLLCFFSRRSRGDGLAAVCLREGSMEGKLRPNEHIFLARRGGSYSRRLRKKGGIIAVKGGKVISPPLKSLQNPLRVGGR